MCLKGKEGVFSELERCGVFLAFNSALYLLLGSDGNFRIFNLCL